MSSLSPHPAVPTIEISPGGPHFSRLVPGLMRLASWGLSPAERLDWIMACLDMGMTTFDHADIYGDYTSEALFGEALALQPAVRQQIQIVTKCGIKLVSPNRPDHRVKHYDTSKAHILVSVENSLRVLHTDYIDLLLIHRPDALMDADEVAEAFVELKAAGRVLHFGVSNFKPWHFDLLASRLPFPLVTNQVELSVMALEVLHDGTLDQCQQLHISPMIWSPLAGGQIFSGGGEQAGRVRAALAEVGQECGGATADQVALAWILHHPARPVPVLGSGRLERLRQAAGAVDLMLTREQWYTIWRASAGAEVP